MAGAAVREQRIFPPKPKDTKMTSNNRKTIRRSRGTRADARRNALSVAVVAGLLSLGVGQAQAQSLHWDGGDSSRWNNGQVDGGNGAWRAGTNVFTTANGATNGPMDPNPGSVVFAGTAGTVTVDNGAGNARVTGMHFAANGYVLEGDAIELVGDAVEIRVGNGMASGYDYYATIRNALTGSGDLVKTDLGNLWLAGNNSYTGDTRVEGGLLVGDANSIRGNLVNNAETLFRNTTDQTYAGNISGTGIMGKMGDGELFLTGTSALEWDIVEGGIVTAADRFGGNAYIESGAWLVFYQNGTSTYAGRLDGAGEFDVESGHVRLTGNSATFSGSTWVGDATLEVNGTLGGSLEVEADATLMGSGTVGHTFVAGTLRGVQGQTLALASLALDAGSTVEVALGAAGNTALFDVGGNLVLDGTLDVSDAGGFGAGVYRLFDYGGTLTDNGLDIGATPAGIDASGLTVQTSVANQVNLLNEGAPDDDPTGDFHFWDGSESLDWANGQVDGGNGTWRVGEHSFTLVDGSENRDMQPAPGFAVFQGAAGTVTVDNAAGDAQVTGMQFATDGYVVEGDAIALHGEHATIRVGDGSAAGAAMVATIHSGLTGSAGLIKNDLGTLVLRGDNSYAGGTLVQAGTLVGDAGSIRGALVNNASVIFDQDDDGSFAGSMSGSGEMSKIGNGVLTLGGDSSLDWRIDEGGLRATAGRFTGDATIGTGAQLDFLQASGAGYAGALAGEGLFRISGAGELTLSGDSSGFAGQTLLDGGTLSVTGQLGGALSVASGARLTGTGSVGDLTVHGTIAPGNGIGALNVGGNLLFGAGAVYEADVDDQGHHDRIVVSGQATLEGGSVLALASGGNFAPLTSYTLLSAAGGVQGEFGTVSSSLAFLTPSLAYGANDVTLTLERNALAFPDVAASGNQAGVASAVESLGMGNALHDAVVVLDEDDARAAFDRLSGEVHAGTARMLLDDSRFIREASLRQARNAAVRTPLQGMQEGERSAWARGIGAWASQDGDGNAAGFDRTRHGLLAGGDVALGDGWTLGLAGGYSRATLTIGERGSSADTRGYQLALYGGWQSGPWGVRFGAAQARDDVDTVRDVRFNGFADRVDAAYEARTTQAFAEMAYGLKFKNAILEPYANLARVEVRGDAIAESGDAAALHGRLRDAGATYYAVGLRGEQDFAVGNAGITAHGGVAWTSASGATAEAGLAFAGTDGFTVRSVDAGSAIAADLGIEGSIGRNATLGVSWNGVFGGGAQDNGLRLLLNWKF